MKISWAARLTAALASSLLALLWAACGGRVVVDAGQTSTAGVGGEAGGFGTSGGTGGTGGAAGTTGGTGGAGGCDLCHPPPSTCVTNQDCCVGGCLDGHCFFSPPAGLYCCLDDQCPPGTVCDLTVKACRGCMSDAQCFGVNPTCDPDAGLCH